jgi:preprotein translocase subunit SecD
MGSSGSFDAIYREVENLVAVLRHGALPAPIEPQFERQVGPSLGQESVRSGVTAMLVGSVLVIIFMVFYYRKSGIIANLALILNIVFILAMLTAVQATVTLPGIAGIILTVGMAVDANVIVFERIREELRLGKTPRDAVSAGYSKALWTVLDANITTAIAALVLANYGTGPIRGFAVTLIFGIISSVFTALFVTRLIFEFVLTKNRSQQLSI